MHRPLPLHGAMLAKDAVTACRRACVQPVCRRQSVVDRQDWTICQRQQGASSSESAGSPSPRTAAILVESLQVPAGLAALAAGAGAEDDDSSEGSFQADAPSPKPPDPKARASPRSS